jgi:hypothetical protein
MSRVALAAVVLALAASGGCAADISTPSYQFGLFPNVAYSGFNANGSFKVMFATGATAPQWSVGDPSIATVAPSVAPTITGVSTKGLSFALVTVLKAGQTTVSVTQGGTTLTSQLMVKAYADGDLVVGKARYENPDPNNDPARPPCASCHQKPGGVDHSPLKMAGFDDDVILGVIQNATYPASPSGQSITSDFSPTGPLTLPANVTHKWNLTDPEKVGILAELRSLPLGGVE